MQDIYIVAAKRTPQGRFLGALAKRSSVNLAIAAGKAALEGLERGAVDQVIVGNVLSAGQGMNVARQVGMGLGLPIEVPAFTVNMMCASGMQAVLLGAQAIRAGEAKAVLCGGTESMSRAPFLLDRARSGYKLGDGVLIDSLLRDGLIDAFDNMHMGITAERLATEYDLSRRAQDAFAAESQQRYMKAWEEGVFEHELVKLDELERDEHPRPDTTTESLAALKPVFDPEAGTVTAGNASGINDGAAMLVLCEPQEAQRRGWEPLARLTWGATAGCDPRVMGMGPVHATRKLCAQSGYELADFDTIELNEAFASQSLACITELGLNHRYVNPHGGAIAMGHPIGASGSRLLVHLAHLVAQGQSQRGLATLCVGGGMGAAAAVER